MAADWTMIAENTHQTAGTGAADYAIPGTELEFDVVVVFMACDNSLSGVGVTEPGYEVETESTGTPGSSWGAKEMSAPRSISLAASTCFMNRINRSTAFKTWVVLALSVGLVKEGAATAGFDSVTAVPPVWIQA